MDIQANRPKEMGGEMSKFRYEEDAPPPVVKAANSGAKALENSLKDLTFGAIGGMVGKLLEYPFDTVKVRLQSQPDHLPLRYDGPLDCFKQSIKSEGISGLYRGLSAPLLGAALENASLFVTYELAQKAIWTTAMPKDKYEEFRRSREIEKAGGKVPELPFSAMLVAGSISGALTSLVLTPIELVKCRMQVPMQSVLDPALRASGPLAVRSFSPLAVIKDVYRREGVKGFWRGQLGTLIRETGGSAAWFGSHEAIVKYYKNRQRALHSGISDKDLVLPLWQHLLSGAVAGCSYNFLFYPADTIKSKIQTGELAVHGRQTFMNVGGALWVSHGLGGLYRGCGITLLRSAPSSALIFTVYEALKKKFPLDED